VVYKSRPIAGYTFKGKTRGGGSETIEAYRNGPLYITRGWTKYTPGFPMTSYYQGGAVYAQAPSLPTYSDDTDSQVRSKGQKAFGASIPTSPSVNLLTSAGELAADGFPNPWDLIRWRRSVKDLLQGTAQNYVAVQFAWLPLKREIETWFHQVSQFDRAVQTAKKQSGQNRIKVGFSFPVDSPDPSYSAGTINAVGWNSGTFLGDLAKGGTTKSASKRVWFEATYQHLLPSSRETEDAISSYAEKARYGLGIGLTPETLWELAPWSFAVDWATSAGDLLKAVSSTLNDGLVMRNGFVMCHTVKRAETIATSPHMSSGQVLPYRFTPTSTTVFLETKRRFPAVPYFGFGPAASYSLKQLSILAALGISRA